MSFITSGVAVFSRTYGQIPPAVTGFVMSNSTIDTIDLVWNASPGATLYTIVSSNEFSEPTTETTSGTSFLYTELNTAAYTFTITPSNEYGNGPPTVLSIPAFPDYAPALNNTPLSATTTTIEFEWFEYIPPDADSYKVYCYDGATYELLYTQTCPLTPLYYTFTGLQTNYKYAFALSSVNERGEQLVPGSLSSPMYTIPTVTGVSVSNPTTTTVDITWDAPTTNLDSYDFLYTITSTPETTQQDTSAAPYAFYGLTPGTEYTFTVTPQVGPDYLAGDPVTSDPIYTLFEPAFLTYTGTVETMNLPPGTYNFEIAGGSGPSNTILQSGAHSYGAFNYTVTSPITIQYAIGQASPGNIGGAGGTYMYDTTNSQWLFVAGGAGAGAASLNPSDNDPGDGSGGAAGDGGGSGAGVNSNGGNSTVSAGSGGLTVANGATGGAGGTFGTILPGGFGGGGGGTVITDGVIGDVLYPGGGGGYTGGSTSTSYIPEEVAAWASSPGTSYIISGATMVSWTGLFSGTSQNGYLNIYPV
jgi:hypothetical protein